MQSRLAGIGASHCHYVLSQVLPYGGQAKEVKENGKKHHNEERLDQDNWPHVKCQKGGPFLNLVNTVQGKARSFHPSGYF